MLTKDQRIAGSALRAREAGRFKPATAWALWGILAAAALWRLTLAGWFLAGAQMQVGGSGVGVAALMIRWQRLDELTPWVALGLLVLGGATGVSAQSAGAARKGSWLAMALVVGAGLTALGLALEQLMALPVLGAGLSLAGGGVLLLVALLMAGGQFLSLVAAWSGKPGPDGRRGVTILDLWRLAGVQWLLLTAAVLVYVRVARRDEVAGNEAVRTLLFMLPAVGVALNALMAAGIQFWSRIPRQAPGTAPPQRPRVRAWLVALGLANLGGLLMVIRPAWLGLPGGVLVIMGIGMYAAGFPGLVWRGLGGRMALGAWGILAVALGAAMLERLAVLAQQPVSIHFSAAWKHLWMVGAVTLWVMGMAVAARGRSGAAGSPTGQGRDGVAVWILALMACGIVLTSGVQLAAAARGGDAAMTLRWLAAGALAESAALGLAGVALVRWSIRGRQSA